MGAPRPKPSRSLIPFLPSIPNRTDGKPPPKKRPSRFALPPRLRPYVLVIGTLVMAVLGASVAWALSSPAKPGKRAGFRPVPVLLTVDTNLPVSATVYHQRVEERSPRDMAELLGHTPELRDVEGAHVGDRIVLENAAQGLSYGYTIEYGQPGEQILLRKEFRTGHVQFRIKRQDAYGLGVYRNSTQLAPYAPDIQIELVEGPHVLEIRGPDLRRPVKVAVEVTAGETTLVDAPRLDLLRTDTGDRR